MSYASFTIDYETLYPNAEHANIEEIQRLKRLARSQVPTTPIPMTTRKYKLIGSLFNHQTGDIFEDKTESLTVAGTKILASESTGVCVVIDESKFADYFELVQDRPYPFTPKLDETYYAHYNDEELPAVEREIWEDLPKERAWLEALDIWRTRSDAQLRAGLEPLFNRALQAVINRGDKNLVARGLCYTINRDAVSGWHVVKTSRVTGTFDVTSGAVFSTREDAVAVVAFLRALFA